MSYDALYRHCQSLEPVIHRNVIRDEVLRLIGSTETIRTFAVELDTDVTWGFLMRPTNSNHAVVQIAGTKFICIARSLLKNRCKCRMVVVKELMHLFDNPEESTDTEDKFSILLRELSGTTAGKTSAMWQSEQLATWMALGVMCPETHRLRLKSEYERGLKTAYDVALFFRIPEGAVPIIFDDVFLEVMEIARGI